VKVDPVSFNIISQALISLTKEMNLNLIRAAYSTIIREVQDASAAFLDIEGNVIAQSSSNAIHLNSIGSAFRGCMEKHPLSEIQEDDILINNDPYHGGQHLPDIFLFSPIFYKKKLTGFAGSVGHHLDVGGGGASSLNPMATDIYSEGFVIPAIRISHFTNFNEGFFSELFSSNVRVPQKTLGDLNAQLAANRTGIKRVLKLVEKHGLELVLEVMNEFLNYTERMTRPEIERIPPGSFSGEEILEGDPLSNRDFKVKVNIEIKGSNIKVDFLGTDPQAKGMINAPKAATISSVHTAFKSLLTGESIPANEGCNRPIQIHIPYGTVINPYPPAPVRGRINACLRVFDVILRAFSKALPQRLIASGFNTSTLLSLSYITKDRYEVFTEPVRGGYGAGPFNDGACQCGTPMDNCTNTPVEAIENDYTSFRLIRYELIPELSGDGQFRGSPGARREFEILKDGVSFASFSDRHSHRPWGLFGGGEGGCGGFIVKRGSKKIKLQSHSTFNFQAGDILSVIIGGGGGYGPPKRRKKEMVLQDLIEEKISMAKAKKIYGASINQNSLKAKK
jgi:N-methylhydantoinase B